ncbi:hypothetical protein [Asticcacaulis taihuensis]|jgi:hypothetical protein|nr:hypothetical protein [Asticcacaulis taihuensis]
MKDEVKRQEMVLHGAEQLFIAERSIKAAMCDTAALISSLSQMSTNGVSVMIGQEAFEEAAATFTALTTARGAIVRTHNALDEVKTQLGCGAMAAGITEAKPPKTGDAIMIEPRRAA